jgi:hypothetical protein
MSEKTFHRVAVVVAFAFVFLAGESSNPACEVMFAFGAVAAGWLA